MAIEEIGQVPNYTLFWFLQDWLTLFADTDPKFMHSCGRRHRLWGAAQERAPKNWETPMYSSVIDTIFSPIFWFPPIFSPPQYFSQVYASVCGYSIKMPTQSFISLAQQEIAIDLQEQYIPYPDHLKDWFLAGSKITICIGFYHEGDVCRIYQWL